MRWNTDIIRWGTGAGQAEWNLEFQPHPKRCLIQLRRDSDPEAVKLHRHSQAAVKRQEWERRPQMRGLVTSAGFRDR
jgi:hypothetical protein